jgi:hypothetical protein
VPDDGIATLDNAFAMRSEAERYLYTCYSYMPRDGQLDKDPAIMGGDELWDAIDAPPPMYDDVAFRIARGLQNAASPLVDPWPDLYQGLRVCNIFLENIDAVPDLTAIEKEQWVGEVIFLKAYYHFYLLRMYGPVPIIRENLPISASPDQVKVSRDPVDECFDYIIELLDQAIPKLPVKIMNPMDELGRITKPIAASLKAKVLVTAASPLFNGNNDQSTLRNKDGRQLFNTGVNKARWDSAVVACREAIAICDEADIVLYKYEQRGALSDTILQELTVRNTLTEKWNSEIIWANTQAVPSLQTQSSPNLDAVKYPDNYLLKSRLQPPLKIAEMYYTNHGVPIEEDKSWQSLDPFELRVGDISNSYYIKTGYTTIQLHFDREPRFYACLGFDGGIWYGQRIYGNNPSEYFYVECRDGKLHGYISTGFGPITGYYPKKYIHFESVHTSLGSYTAVSYPWPIMRLADLYLLYAEAINESEGPNGSNSGEMFKYIDLVREKAGLEGVKYSWDNYANTKKYENQSGMRQIIHRERMIELSLEGQRFWDLRRWKEAPDEFAKDIVGYALSESDPAKFYTRTILAKQPYPIKNYFWPIRTSYIENNPNLVQNIGW